MTARDKGSAGVYVRDERSGVAAERSDDVAAIAAALRLSLDRGVDLDEALREIEADRLADEVF